MYVQSTLLYQYTALHKVQAAAGSQMGKLRST